MLVGLLCNFRQEVGARKDATHREFMEWLANHRHNELRDLISQTHHLQSEVDDLLRLDHSEIRREVDRANQVLVDILGRLDHFKGLVQAIQPAPSLSAQALQILRQVLDSGYGGVASAKGGSVIVCFRYGEYGPPLHLTDLLLADDDIHALASSGLLRLETSNGGLKWFKITRAGCEYLKTIEDAR